MWHRYMSLMCCLPPWQAPLECVHGMARATPAAQGYSDEVFSCGKSNKAELFNPAMLEIHQSRESMWQQSHGTVQPATHFRNLLLSRL